MLKRSTARFFSALHRKCTDNGKLLISKAKQNLINIDKKEVKGFMLTCVTPIICLSLLAGGVATVIPENNKDISPKKAKTQITEITRDVRLSPVATVSEYDVPENKSTLTMAYGFYAGGVLIGAVIDGSKLPDLTDGILMSSANEAGEGAIAEFANVTSVQPGLYKTTEICSLAELKELILSKEESAVKVTYTDTEYSQIEYETITRYDNTMYEGDMVVSQQGMNGVEMSVSSVTTVNGKEVERRLITKNITREPINRVVVEGTKLVAGIPSGSFSWPCSYTYTVYSPFGYRWGTNHNGIDISANGIHGAAIQASDGGVVSLVRYDNYGYGYHIEIDHGNGFVTRYAHCSDIYVTEGESVKKGENIGAVGCTGDSTGSHLHFEILQDGYAVDPELYLY